MTFKRYNYCLQWYGKDVNDSELLGLPVESDVIVDIRTLNNFFDMTIMGLQVKRINLSINENIEEIYNMMRERFLKSLGGLFG